MPVWHGVRHFMFAHARAFVRTQAEREAELCPLSVGPFVVAPAPGMLGYEEEGEVWSYPAAEQP